MDNRYDIHTTPVHDLVPHDNKRECWCQPSIHRICPECPPPEDIEGGDKDWTPDPDCYRCGGAGAIEASPDEPDRVHVLHNAIDGRE